jgi:hypothetical protein
MEQEDKSEIADQVSEFRKEALNSTDNIAEISKALKEALDNQSSSIDRAENEIAASSQSEETQASTITGISNSLSDLLGVQKEILDSLKGLNKNIGAATQQQGDSLEEGGVEGGGASPISSVFSGGSGTGIQLASFGGGGGGFGGGYGGGGGFDGGSNFNGNMGTGEGLTEEKSQAITDFAEKYNINPNALAGVLSVESNFDTSIRGGAGGNYSGIFQLQSQQIAGLTESVFGDALTPEEYRNLSFKDQLKVYEKYMLNAVGDEEGMRDFFTGDAEQDTSRLWALQLAPGNAKNIDYNNPNALISGSRQAESISAPGGGVTVGSSTGSLNMGGLLDEQPMTPLTLNWGGELPENITEGLNEITLTDPVSGEEFSVNFEVENVDGNLATVGPVTLAQDTDLEGISGAAGDPVEVSAEIAQDLADQTGASLEPTDLETPATPEGMGGNNNTEMTPEVSTTPVDLEENIIEANASTAERTVASPQQTQTAAADYSEDKPKTVTGGNWHAQVKDYYVMT